MAGNGDRSSARSSGALPRMEKVAEARLPTEVGEFRVIGFQDATTGREYIVLAKGDLSPERPCLVRIHSQCLTGDVFHSIKCDCGRQLRRAMELIEREGVGVLIYQQQEGRGIGLLNKIRAYELQDQGLDTVEANVRLGFAPDERSYEDCIAILRALGIHRVRLLSNNPHKIAALQKAGLCIVERVPLEVEPTEETVTYLRAKKEKLGHLLSSV